jgi:hypothetical protein
VPAPEVVGPVVGVEHPLKIHGENIADHPRHEPCIY